MKNCRVLVNDGNLCGEAPVWDADKHLLYWVDCLSSKLFVYDWMAKRHQVMLDGFQVNGLALCDGGGFIFANSAGMWQWNGRSHSVPQLIASEAEGIQLQLNDCIADPRGRMLAGTCFYSPYQNSQLGHLVRVDTDGRAAILDEGFRLANGMSFSPDGSMLYFADSVERTIYVYGYNAGEGRIGVKRLFAQLGAECGLPDGLTVDEEGFLWFAEWYGSCIKRYDPDGKLERTVAIPAKQTSSLIFGGPRLQNIFVTSAALSERMPEMPADYDAETGYFGGALFELDTEIRGRLDHKARLSVATSKE